MMLKAKKSCVSYSFISEKTHYSLEFIQDVKETSSEGSKSEKSPEDYILSELKKYVKKHQDFFQEIEEARGTRTRSEELFTKETAFNWISDYIDKLWLGISERLKYFD